VLGTFEGLEIGSHLLLGFQAADVSFRLIIRKRDIFYKSKSKPPVLMFDQAMEQVSAFGFFRLTLFALDRGRFFAVSQLADMFELPPDGAWCTITVSGVSTIVSVLLLLPF